MCVTNTTHRRVQAVTLTPNQIGVCPSALSQRLLGAFPGQQHLVQLPPACGSTSFDATTEIAYHSHEEKSRPKRRRKPQKPGKTAKMNERHFVVHNYHDHAFDLDDEEQHSEDPEENGRRRGGVAVAFPLKLHSVLEQVERDGLSHVVSWSPHGRCFVIHKPHEFVEELMPKYFRQSKLTSFQRQLNLYGFARLTRGPDAGGYYHELFLRNREYLCKKMMRTKVKGTKFKAASSPESEPDFYSMPPVVTPHHSDEEEMSYDSSQRTSEYFVQGAAHIPMYASYQAQPSQMTLPPLSSFASLSMPSPFASLKSSSDQILDDAVDELFLNELGEQDNLTDFVNDWEPASFGNVLSDDAQLGFMLEKLLED